MDKQKEVFRLIAGRDPFKEDVLMLARVRDALNLQVNDGFWVALVIFQAHMSLLSEIPGKVAQSADGVMRDVKEAARLHASIEVTKTIQSSHEEISRVLSMHRNMENSGISDLEKQVVNLAQREDENAPTLSVRKPICPWITKSFWVMLVACVVAGAGGYWVGERQGAESGFKQGYLYMHDEQEALTWSATPLGMIAHQMSKSGVLEMLVKCAGKGWMVSNGKCTPKAFPGEGTYGWPMPDPVFNPMKK